MATSERVMANEFFLMNQTPRVICVADFIFRPLAPEKISISAVSALKGLYPAFVRYLEDGSFVAFSNSGMSVMDAGDFCSLPGQESRQEV